MSPRDDPFFSLDVPMIHFAQASLMLRPRPQCLVKLRSEVVGHVWATLSWMRFEAYSFRARRGPQGDVSVCFSF